MKFGQRETVGSTANGTGGVKQGLVERGSRETIGVLALNHGLQPWQEKCGGSELDQE